MAKDTKGKKDIRPMDNIKTEDMTDIDINNPDDLTKFAVQEVKKGHVRNPNPVIMSVKEDDPERAKVKADIFNRLWELQNRRGIAKFNDVEEMEIVIGNYFQDCAELKLRPTIRGLASALGTVWSTLNTWESGSRDAQLGSGCSLIIKKAKQFIAEYDEIMALEGVDNPVLYMFRSKNYYGMSDKQEITVTPNTQLESTKTVDEMYKEIEQDIPLDDE